MIPAVLQPGNTLEKKKYKHNMSSTKKQKTKEEHSGRKKGKCKGPEARMEKKEING